MRWEDDGLHLRQSDIGTYIGCPEQFRLVNMSKNGEHFESDAALVGSTVHAVIENELNNGFYESFDDAQKFGAYWFLQKLEEYHADPLCTFSVQTFGTPEKALRALVPLVDSWMLSKDRQLLLAMPAEERLVEWKFDLPFTSVELDTGPLPIWLTGTADLVLPGINEVWDWKTASGPYQRWEKQRWAVQPTVYTWAAAQADLVLPQVEGYRFNYKVIVRRQNHVEIDTVPVNRREGNFAWLAMQVHQMVYQMAGMPEGLPWLMNDHNVLCSPKWCPAWGSCKGALIDDEKWT